MKVFNSNISIVPYIVTVAMLIGAPFYNWPQGYYTGLRIMCSLCFLMTLLALPRWTLWISMTFIILYNPITPIYLTKEIWTPINITTIIILTALYVASRMGMRNSNPALEVIKTVTDDDSDPEEEENAPLQ